MRHERLVASIRLLSHLIEERENDHSKIQKAQTTSYQKLLREAE
jgi:hypothetical protein